ncbi:MAG: histidine--tRNA ligase [Actinobacteria bacterium]|nr:histidine--tRNA ligase [Actinomycetota bacterium]
MDYRAPKGTVDMLPDAASEWERISGIAQDIFWRYGYEPVYTPLFEHTEVFSRGIGEATDIVSKEMYTFLDRSDPPNSLTLRPEGTASVVRAAIQHNLVPPGVAAKLYYMGPMFRYERPQKGRMRQFWQVGAEILGAPEPTADAEAIALMWRFFQDAGIPAESMRLLINSMGDEECRPAYRELQAGFIVQNASRLCEECSRRAQTNPLRAFDCKNPACVEVMAEAPLLRDQLCGACADHYSAVKGHLDTLAIPYQEAPRLVRGLDYYTRTVFEVQVDAGLGSQNAIGGGGRYDRLFEQFGGKSTPGLGFAVGFERMMLALQATGANPPAEPRIQVFVARVDATVAGEVFSATQRLRDAGFAAEMDHLGRSLKAQFKYADKLGAPLVVVVGPEEIAAGEVTLRRMDTKQESRVALTELVEAVWESYSPEERV